MIERDLHSLAAASANVTVIKGFVCEIDEEGQKIHLSDGREVLYDALCIATGAKPKLIVDHPLVVGIRDTESVDSLCHRLKDAKKVLVIGECSHIDWIDMSKLI